MNQMSSRFRESGLLRTPIPLPFFNKLDHFRDAEASRARADNTPRVCLTYQAGQFLIGIAVKCLLTEKASLICWWRLADGSVRMFSSRPCLHATAR